MADFVPFVPHAVLPAAGLNAALGAVDAVADAAQAAEVALKTEVTGDEASFAALQAQVATLLASLNTLTATVAAAATTSSSSGGGGGSAGAMASPFLPPKVADFSLGWLGQNANASENLPSTAVDTATGLRLTGAPCNQNQNQLRGLLRPIADKNGNVFTSDYELVAHIRMPSPFANPVASYGFGWAVQATRSCDVTSFGTTISGSIPYGATYHIDWTVTNSDATCTVNNVEVVPMLSENDLWFNLRDDGTNRFFYIGTEGVEGPWHLIFSVARADPGGLGNLPDAIGLFVSACEVGNVPPNIGLPCVCDYWDCHALPTAALATY